MTRKYTKEATEDFLRYLIECGPQTRQQMINAGWWSRIHSRLDRLTSSGVLRKTSVANEDSGEKYARIVCSAWAVGDAPYVRERKTNLSADAARKGRETVSLRAKQRRIQAAIDLLRGAGYRVLTPTEDAA